MRVAAESVMVPAKAAPFAAGGVVDNLALLRSDARTPQAAGAALRVEVDEDHLQTNAAVSRAELNVVLGRTLTGVSACAGTRKAGGVTRMKIFFDGKGRVSRVEPVDPKAAKDAAAFLACVQTAIRNALVLPWPAGGYLVVRIS